MELNDMPIFHMSELSIISYLEKLPREELIGELSYVSGYEERFLADVLEEMEADAQAGEPIDIRNFIETSLELDW